jgi:hypothetical protein
MMSLATCLRSSCQQGVMTYPPLPAAEEDEEEKPGDSYAGHMEHGKRHGHGKCHLHCIQIQQRCLRARQVPLAVHSNSAALPQSTTQQAHASGMSCAAGPAVCAEHMTFQNPVLLAMLHCQCNCCRTAVAKGMQHHWHYARWSV